MKFLRTVSTQRLLAMIAGLVAAVAVGTAIAVAAGGAGPVPPAKPLAQAIHNALGAPAVDGITAHISFTNHLIDSSNLQGSDPLLTGATGRLWLSSDHRLRLELQSVNGDAQVVVDNSSFSVYDPSSNTVYEGTLPASTAKPDAIKPGTAKNGAIPSVAQLQTDLGRLMNHVDLSGATSGPRSAYPIRGNVAGQAAYTIRVSPKHDGGLLGAGELAWDAVRGVPLRIAVYARGGGSPVLELKATNISYGAVSASDLSASPPPGVKVVKISAPAGQGAGAASDRRSTRHRHHADVNGVAAVARSLQFKLRAPTGLVGLPRRSVALLDWVGSPAALVTYGQNLGGVAVIEQTAHSAQPASPTTSGDHQGLNLPTVSIHGATGQELDTALGTMVRFTRNGVSYTVVGSVPAAAAEAAARAITRGAP